MRRWGTNHEPIIAKRMKATSSDRHQSPRNSREATPKRRFLTSMAMPAVPARSSNVNPTCARQFPPRRTHSRIATTEAMNKTVPASSTGHATGSKTNGISQRSNHVVFREGGRSLFESLVVRVISSMPRELTAAILIMACYKPERLCFRSVGSDRTDSH